MSMVKQRNGRDAMRQTIAHITRLREIPSVDGDRPKTRRRRGWRLVAAAVSAVVTASSAHATDFIETTDYSGNGAAPTLLVGGLTKGSNLINGAITSYGAVVGQHGELANPDMDFVTFTVPIGYALTSFIVSNGTTIAANDLLFLGLASGSAVNYDPTFNSASGLIGWTLVSGSQVGADILPAIGKASYPNFPVPGAPGFTGPLAAGTYSLWLFDGDHGATYSFNAVVAPVPEAATWMMMIAGFGMMGAALRARRTRVAFAAA